MTKELLFVLSLLQPYDLPPPDIAYVTGLPDRVHARIFCGTQPSTGKDTCKIALSYNCLYGKSQEILEEAVAHELAHYVEFMLHGKMNNHRHRWKLIMKRWGYDEHVDTYYADRGTVIWVNAPKWNYCDNE